MTQKTKFLEYFRGMANLVAMRYLIILLLVVSAQSYGNLPPWSKTGHRVVGAVATEYLSSKARKAVSELLDGQSLAAVSNYADEIKADRKYKEFSPWHYVNIPEGKDYHEVTPSKYGDLITGIGHCVKVLEDRNSRREDRIFYLKMLIHLVGDLHQPMHVGREEDKGGNDIQLQWFGRGTNLHKLWDTEMINDYGMSFTELAQSLPKVSRKARNAMQAGTVFDWVEESQEQANIVYGSAGKGEKLAYSYSYKYWGTVELQLLRGGIRLAKVLNDIFG